MPKALKLGYGSPITTVPSRKVQEYVSAIGSKLAQSSTQMQPHSSKTKLRFRFYVVQSSEALRQKKFATVNGTLPYNISDYGKGQYVYHKSTYYPLAEDNTIALQSGTVLVPDTVLARLNNKAQLAALLADSIASILQNNVLETALLVEGTGPNAINLRFAEALRINQQVLRLGIRLMYQAGYDIRELPFAWTVAQGNLAQNPVIDTWHADRKIPWYASYAFLCISERYPNADYSKLQRGEKEYSQFLQDLYQADPTLKKKLPENGNQKSRSIASP